MSAFQQPKAKLLPKDPANEPRRTSSNHHNTARPDYLVGFGWDPLEGSEYPFDGDVMVFLLDAEDKVIQNGAVYHGHPIADDGSCYIGRDNLTGEGPGDDECARVCPGAVGDNVFKIVVVANIHQARKRKQHFGLPEAGFVRIIDRSGVPVAHRPLRDFASVIVDNDTTKSDKDRLKADAIVVCSFSRERTAPGGWALDTNMQGVDFHGLMNGFDVEVKY